MKKKTFRPKKVILILLNLSVMVFMGACANNWQRAGFTNGEEQELKECGFIVIPNDFTSEYREGHNAYPWKANGFSSKEACEWVRTGLVPLNALKLKNCGLDPHDWDSLRQTHWSNYFSENRMFDKPPKEVLESLRICKAVGCQFEELPQWREKGISVQESVEWHKNKVTPSQAQEYVNRIYDEEKSNNPQLLGNRKNDPAGFVAAVLSENLKRDYENKQWEDAGFKKEEANSWKAAGFKPDEANSWKRAGVNPSMVRELNKFSFSNPSEVKQFTKKYCINGFAGIPPSNPNDDDGTHCYIFPGKVFQLLADNQALYKADLGLLGIILENSLLASKLSSMVYYISFGKSGRAISLIEAIVSVKGSYKYQSLAGIKVVPELRILRMATKADEQ